jgi:hypothetical protein
MEPAINEMDVFTPPPEPNVFSMPNAKGTGLKTLDDFISARIGLMTDATGDAISNLAIAHENVKQLDHQSLQNYIAGIAGESLRGIELKQVESYAETGDVEGGIKAVAEVRDAGNQPTEVRRLANAAALQLSQWEGNRIAKEIARRQLTMAIFAKKIEEAGIDMSDWKEKVLAVGGTIIPSRLTIQTFSDKGRELDLANRVKSMFAMNDEEFFKVLPDVLDLAWEVSGGNPIMFMERAEAFLNPDDIKWLRAWLALDVVDTATLLAGLPKLLKLTDLARATNTPIKILRDTGNAKKAAELNVAAMGDEGVAETLRTTRIDAAQNTSPFGGEGFDPNITGRFAPESQALIAERQAAVEAALAPLHDQCFLLRRSAYTEQEIADANKKYVSQLAGNARIVEQLPDGAKIEVDINFVTKDHRAPDVIEREIDALTDSLQVLNKDQKIDALNQRAKLNKELEKSKEYASALEMHRLNPTRTIEVKYTQNDFGELVATEYDRSLRHVNSPMTNVEQLMPGIVEQATAIDFEIPKVLQVFMNARNAALKGVSKKARKKVDSVLMQGDKDKVIYDDNALISGVRTPDGLIKLDTVEEVGAYRAIRENFDVLFELKNRELRRTLELGNFKAVYPNIGEEGINFVNPNKVITLDERKAIKRIYNDGSKQIEDVSALVNRKDILDTEIYKLKYPLQQGDEQVNYILIKPNKLKGIPKYPLAKREGYVPKIDKNVFWVAEMIGDKMIDGVKIANNRTTVRYFDNPLDAKAWTQAQNAKGQVVEVRSGREWLDQSPGRREEFEAQIFGGLYGGKRAKAEVPFGLEGTSAERVGAIEAMEAYMNHIATRMPAVDFRAGLVQRFLNSARHRVTGESFLTNPGDWQSDIRSTIDHKTRSGLEAMQRWTKEQLRIPTTEERLWGALSQKIAEATSRVPGAGRTLSKWSMNIGAKDITSQLRGLSFHATLGWFNPSQLFVQAMGASVAISLARKPWVAVKNISRSIALRASMFAQSDEAIKTIAKAAGLNADEHLQMVRAYQRTGLHESTLSTGDYAALQGWPSGAESLRWVANKGLIFFKEGERFVRNYAWAQAYDELMYLSKGRAVVDDKFIDSVTKLSLRYTLNMNRANRAHWQSGFLSIPTQFWQISAKFIENMLPNMLIKSPNGWTGKEKAMVLLGQVALFGAAGVPFGRAMVDNLTSWLQSEDEFGLAVKDPAVITAAQGGLTEWLLYNWTGERLDVVNRLSIPAGIEQMIEVFTSDSSTPGDLLMGVTGEIGHRTWEMIRANAQILHAVIGEPETFDSTVIGDVLDNVGKVVSSWRNVQKARLWERLHYIPSRDGARILPINDEDNKALLLAQSMGIAPKILDDYYAIKGFNKSIETDYRNATMSVIQIAQRHYNDPDILTNPTKMARFKAEIALVLSSFEKPERLEIMQRVNRKLSDQDYLLPEEMQKAIDNMYKTQDNAALQGNATMVER